MIRNNDMHMALAVAMCRKLQIKFDPIFLSPIKADVRVGVPVNCQQIDKYMS